MRPGVAALLCAALASPAAAQDEAALLDLRGGTGPLRVTEADYRAHLRATIGEARLEELCVDRLLERAVAAIDRAELPVGPRTVLDDPEAAAARGLQRRLAELFDGDRAGWRRYLEQSGRTAADELALCRIEALREARVAVLVLRERVVDEALLRRLFEDRHGPGGVLLRLRHRLYGFVDAEQRLRAARPGRPVDAAQVEAMTQAAVAQGLREVAAGGDDLAILDPEAIADYRFQRFGVDFAASVREAVVGTVLGPVRSSAGLHLVVVDERRVTRFEDEREALTRDARERPPTLAEWQRLRQRLLVESGAATQLQARRQRR